MKKYPINTSDKPITKEVEKEKLMDGEKSCKVCNVQYNSLRVKRTHLNGDLHRKNMVHAQANSVASFPSLFNLKALEKHQKEKSKSTEKCELCSVTITSPMMWQQHLAGKRHGNNLRKQKLNN